jgi:maltose O-acetyltransferase
MVKVFKLMKPGNGNIFEDGIYISDGKNISIGCDCEINENVFIQGARIGNYVMIAPNVSILADQHIHDRIDIPMACQGKTEKKFPVIEDDVWIGRNAVIMPGITLAKGTIVGAGAVVTKSTEPYTIVGGVPARMIKKRENKNF